MTAATQLISVKAQVTELTNRHAELTIAHSKAYIKTRKMASLIADIEDQLAKLLNEERDLKNRVLALENAENARFPKIAGFLVKAAGIIGAAALVTTFPTAAVLVAGGAILLTSAACPRMD